MRESLSETKEPKAVVKTGDGQICAMGVRKWGQLDHQGRKQHDTVSAMAPSRLTESIPLVNSLCSHFCLCKAVLSHFLAALFLHSWQGWQERVQLTSADEYPEEEYLDISKSSSLQGSTRYSKEGIG